MLVTLADDLRKKFELVRTNILDDGKFCPHHFSKVRRTQNAIKMTASNGDMCF